MDWRLCYLGTFIHSYLEPRQRGAAVAVRFLLVGQARIPAAARRGEKDILERGLGAAERADAVAVRRQGVQEFFAEVGFRLGHQRGGAEAVRAAVAEGGDLEGGLDGRQVRGERGGVAGELHAVAGVAENL